MVIKLNPEFCQAKVRITQGPAQQEKEIFFDFRKEKEFKIEKTWLRNYFQDDTVYGLELTSIGNQIVWEFFLKALDPKDGLIKGHALFNFLKKTFQGLSGKVDVIPIYSFMLEQDPIIYELKIPQLILYVPKLQDFETLSIISNFIQINKYNSNKERIMKLYVIWQRDNSIQKTTVQKTTEYKDFNAKIFLRADNKNNPNNKNELQQVLFQSELEYLAMNIYNIYGGKFPYSKAPLNTWRHILEGNVFSENLVFINPKHFDFNFPPNSGLPKPFILENEHIIDLPIDKNDKSHVCFGKIVRQGVLTEDIAFAHINDFAQSCIIAGATGTGKTYAASLIINEISKKAPQVGILGIGLSKKDQAHYFKPDKILKYGDKELQVPYFVKPSHECKTLEKYALETAMFLTASIGLKNTATTVTYTTMMSFDKAHSLPEYTIELFEATLDYLDDPEHKYHEKFQTNIKSEINNTVSQRLSDSIISETLKLRPFIPQWFTEWRQGKNIYIDLTECNAWTKIILANALFQMIKTLTSHLEADELHNLIVIDEPDPILAKALSTSPYDDMVIAKERLEIVFKELLEEFRSRGIAFTLIDQEPSSLFKCVSKSPALKIVFRLDLENGRCLTLDEKELNYLKNQRKRYALFFNGATGEEYIIRTIDYEY